MESDISGSLDSPALRMLQAFMLLKSLNSGKVKSQGASSCLGGEILCTHLIFLGVNCPKMKRIAFLPVRTVGQSHCIHTIQRPREMAEGYFGLDQMQVILTYPHSFFFKKCVKNFPMLDNIQIPFEYSSFPHV